jgi:hypothetical protein
MYALSECVTCIVIAFAGGAILFGFAMLSLAIKDRLENRTARHGRSKRPTRHFGLNRLGLRHNAKDQAVRAPTSD